LPASFSLTPHMLLRRRTRHSWACTHQMHSSTPAARSLVPAAYTPLPPATPLAKYSVAAPCRTTILTASAFLSPVKGSVNLLHALEASLQSKEVYLAAVAGCSVSAAQYRLGSGRPDRRWRVRRLTVSRLRLHGRRQTQAGRHLRPRGACSIDLDILRTGLPAECAAAAHTLPYQARLGADNWHAPGV
jgi:hypothetical protein